MGNDRIRAKIEALELFQNKVNDQIKRIILSLETIVTEMNTEDQLFDQGINSEGESIISYAPYSDITIEIKRELGQPVDRVTLRDEGDFHDSFELEEAETGVLIVAKDTKTDELIFQYGDSIIGLTEDNLEELAFVYVLPKLLEYLNGLVLDA